MNDTKRERGPRARSVSSVAPGGAERNVGRKKTRKYYLLQPKWTASAPCYSLENAEELKATGELSLMTSPVPYEPGFRNWPVRPRFRIAKTRRGSMKDMEDIGDFLLISQRAKEVLAGLSDTDFRFLAVDTEVAPGEPPRPSWLCEVMPLLDAVDEARSRVYVGQSTDGRRIHLPDGLSSLVFDEAVIDGHHAFRLATSYSTIVVDETFRHALKQAGLTGLSFRDAFKR